KGADAERALGLLRPSALGALLEEGRVRPARLLLLMAAQRLFLRAEVAPRGAVRSGASRHVRQLLAADIPAAPPDPLCLGACGWRGICAPRFPPCVRSAGEGLRGSAGLRADNL